MKKYGLNIKETPTVDWVARFVNMSTSWVSYYKAGSILPTKENDDLLESALMHYKVIRHYVGRMLLTKSKKELIELFKTFLSEK